MHNVTISLAIFNLNQPRWNSPLFAGRKLWFCSLIKILIEDIASFSLRNCRKLLKSPARRVAGQPILPLRNFRKLLKLLVIFTPPPHRVITESPLRPVISAESLKAKSLAFSPAKDTVCPAGIPSLCKNNSSFSILSIGRTLSTPVIPSQPVIPEKAGISLWLGTGGQSEKRGEALCVPPRTGSHSRESGNLFVAWHRGTIREERRGTLRASPLIRAEPASRGVK